MTAELSQRLLSAVFDGAPVDDELIRDLAETADGHAELVRLAVVLAELPGDGARAAEARLDDLLEHVTLVAAQEIATQRQIETAR